MTASHGQDGVEVSGRLDLYVEVLEEHLRADEDDAVAEFREAEQVRPRDPAVPHVAHQRQGQPLQASEPAADGQHVEQRLRGMLVRVVAGAEDRALDGLGQAVRGLALLVTDDDGVQAHRLNVAGRVDQRLFLVEAARGRVELEDPRPQALCGERERRARPRRVFAEEVQDRAALQPLRAGPPMRDAGQALVREVEDRQNLPGRHVLEAQEVLSRPSRLAALGHRSAPVAEKARLGSLGRI
jgi:hypothetical protein